MRQFRFLEKFQKIEFNERFDTIHENFLARKKTNFEFLEKKPLYLMVTFHIQVRFYINCTK